MPEIAVSPSAPTGHKQQRLSRESNKNKKVLLALKDSEVSQSNPNYHNLSHAGKGRLAKSNIHQVKLWLSITRKHPHRCIVIRMNRYYVRVASLFTNTAISIPVTMGTRNINQKTYQLMLNGTAPFIRPFPIHFTFIYTQV